MNDFALKRLSVPITTGTPQAGSHGSAPVQRQDADNSFRLLLESKLQGSGVEFSKHAVNRVVERNIPLSESSLDRLEEGFRIAQEKGMNDTLILIDKMAFIVNVKNSKVITTVNGEELKGNAFTNIDGAVIV